MATVTINPGDSIQTDGHDVANPLDTVSLTAGNYFSQSCNVTKDDLIFESATGTRADVKVYGGPQVRVCRVGELLESIIGRHPDAAVGERGEHGYVCAGP